jgi:DNA-3-methyladenine glycosylase
MKPGSILDSKFYKGDVHKIAENLLGKIFVRKRNGNILSGKIVEVEAYDGLIDEASHAFNGKTNRNEVMFRQGGLLYVYFTYGMHYCANVVTGNVDDPKAILLRGIEPLEGIEQMSVNRYGKKSCTQKEFINLTNGPAKLCKAFGIERTENGTDLTGDKIFILDSSKPVKPEIITTTRIGINKSVNLPWRYYIRNNPFISKK